MSIIMMIFKTVLLVIAVFLIKKIIHDGKNLWREINQPNFERINAAQSLQEAENRFKESIKRLNETREHFRPIEMRHPRKRLKEIL